MAKVSQDRQRLLPRDLESLAVVGRFRMLKRSQLHRWKFHGLADTVVRRFIARMVERGWLGTERLNKNGVQVIWCTAAGRDVLIAHGLVPPEEIFPARGPVPVKDMAHTAAIVDAAIRLVELGRAGDRMVPAWTLQRLLGGRVEVIPDLLCLTASTDAHAGAVLAVEVDLANEPVASCLVPKTAKLVSFLRPYCGSAAGILLLTVGEQRRRAIEQAFRTIPVDMPIVIEELGRFTAEGVRSTCSVEGTVREE